MGRKTKLTKDCQDSIVESLKLGLRIEDTIKRAWKDGRFHDSDKWIAFTIGMRDKKLQNVAMNTPELIALQRMKLKLRRAIRDEQKHGEVAKTR